MTLEPLWRNLQWLFSRNEWYSKNCAGVRICGWSIPDSKKSLSPVRRISALALIAARKMGLSAVSRIRDSESVSSVGICTISMDKSAMDRKRFNASILFGNYLLNIRRNSSIFWSQINAWFGKETALRYAWNGVPFGFSIADIRTFVSISILMHLFPHFSFREP